MKWLVVIIIGIFLVGCVSDNSNLLNEYNRLTTGFVTPVDTNKLWCYWYWINDDISKEGVTKDLLAMKKAGIGAALIGNINPAGVDGKVPLFSDEWWDTMVHAVTEGKRIGVDIGVFNCPGWSQSGGPWVESEMAMRYLTFSETKIKGGKNINLDLNKPKSEFQDIRTLAFNTLPAEQDANNLEIKNSFSKPNVSNLNLLFDKKTDSSVEIEIKGKNEVLFEIEFNTVITARQITIVPGKGGFSSNCELYALIDGKYKLIKEFRYDRSNVKVNVGPIVNGPVSKAFEEVVSTKYKLLFKGINTRARNAGSSQISIAEIEISGQVKLEDYIEKQLGKMHPTPLPNWNTYLWKMQNTEISNSSIIDQQNIIDISDNLDANGHLTWDVPSGEWTIMRIGMTPTGTKNSPAAPQGIGYEVDKMNGELAKFHFDNFIGELLNRIPEESKSAFKYVIADSYEMGSQNWTDGYEEKFQAKFGYDPIKYFPVLSGRIVGSVEESERFLWDLRRTIADDVAYEYVGGMKKASNENNLKLWLENYGHWGFPSEFLMYGGQSDLVSGEFWNEGSLGNIECKASSSSAHIYGKNRTSAEAFTASQKSYLRHPAMLKKRGDWSFTEGINHFVLHLYIQQPDDKRIPGMNAWFSTEFNRHNTWFGQAHNYFDYLRRCQHLLQQGQYAADVCYFIGENAPIMTGGRNPEIPKGYSYDYINGEVILNRLSVKNGKFTLPDGMSYSVMVLPPIKTMRPEVLAKLEQLVSEGGVILGLKPEKSPSLQNYPICDQQIVELASKLWSGEYDDGKMTNAYGKGYVFDGHQLSEVFNTLQLNKDVDLDENASVLWTHRTMPGIEIYFITNQSEDKISIQPTFRVNDKYKPQLWNAVNGKNRALNEFEITKTGIKVPINMEAHQSWFVVFSDITSPNLDEGYKENFPEPILFQTINTPFEVNFINKDIGPKEPIILNELKDWAISKDENIKYYSGTAKYSTTFTIDSLPDNHQFFINLNKLGVMAEVNLNDINVGGLWIAPYRLNITDVLKKGKNHLNIEVVNLWRNRLIKDRSLPEKKRYTWLVVDDLNNNSELQLSGILGPITIETLLQ